MKTSTTRKVLSWWWLLVVFVYMFTEEFVIAWVWAWFSLFYVFLWWVMVETGDWR